VQIARPRKKLPGNRAVHDDLMAEDVFEDAGVGRTALVTSCTSILISASLGSKLSNSL
jgi:hypothetical protein